MLSINQRIGKIVRILREENDMTQAELAKHLKIQARAVCQLEKGNIYPPIKSLAIIAKLFGKPLKYFFDFNYVRMSQTDKNRIDAINEDLLTASNEQLMLIQKIVKTIVYK